MIIFFTSAPDTSPCSAFLSPPYVHLWVSRSNSSHTLSVFSRQSSSSKFKLSSTSPPSSSFPRSTGIATSPVAAPQTNVQCHPRSYTCSQPHGRQRALPRTHTQMPLACSQPPQHPRVATFHSTLSVAFEASSGSMPQASTTSTPAATSTSQHPSPVPTTPSISLPAPSTSSSSAPMPIYNVENSDVWPLYTVVAAASLEEPPAVYPEMVLAPEKLQSPFWRALTRSGRHLRLLLLGSSALRREASNARKYAYTPYTVALSRGIVIFADYLADLLVLDLVQDGLRHPCPPLAIAAIAAGIVSGIAAGDALTGVAAWISTRFFPSGFFNFLPTSLTQRRNVVKTSQETQQLSRAHNTSDIFVQLQNSCFLCTPALTVATSVAHEGAELSMSALSTAEMSSAAATVSTSGTATSMTTAMMTSMMIDSMETLTITLYVQTTIAVTLSLCALAPILRPSPSRPDTAVIRLLRSARLLKQHGDRGWAQTSGVADAILNATLPIAERLLARGRRIIRNPKQDE